MHHSNAIWRRLLAYLIDLTLIYFAFSLLLLPWAYSLSSPIAVTSGAFRWSSCGKASIYAADGRSEINLKPGQNLTVCDLNVMALFPSRIAIIQQPGEPGSKFTTTNVSFLVDDKNRIKGQVDTNTAFFVFLMLTLIVLEGSRLSSTPGKLLVGLKVADKNDMPPGFRRAGIRNLFKNLYVPATIISTLILSNGRSVMSAAQVQAMYFDDNLALRPFSQIWDASNATMLLTANAAIGAINLIIILTILLPWGDKGRALYDRIAGTFVVTRP